MLSYRGNLDGTSIPRNTQGPTYEPRLGMDATQRQSRALQLNVWSILGFFKTLLRDTNFAHLLILMGRWL